MKEFRQVIRSIFKSKSGKTSKSTKAPVQAVPSQSSSPLLPHTLPISISRLGRKPVIPIVFTPAQLSDADVYTTLSGSPPNSSPVPTISSRTSTTAPSIDENQRYKEDLAALGLAMKLPLEELSLIASDSNFFLGTGEAIKEADFYSPQAPIDTAIDPDPTKYFTRRGSDIFEEERGPDGVVVPRSTRGIGAIVNIASEIRRSLNLDGISLDSEDRFDSPMSICPKLGAEETSADCTHQPGKLNIIPDMDPLCSLDFFAFAPDLTQCQLLPRVDFAPAFRAPSPPTSIPVKKQHPAFLSDAEFNSLPHYEDIEDDPSYNTFYIHPDDSFASIASLSSYISSSQLDEAWASKVKMGFDIGGDLYFFKQGMKRKILRGVEKERLPENALGGDDQGRGSRLKRRDCRIRERDVRRRFGVPMHTDADDIWFEEDSEYEDESEFEGEYEYGYGYGYGHMDQVEGHAASVEIKANDNAAMSGILQRLGIAQKDSNGPEAIDDGYGGYGGEMF